MLRAASLDTLSSLLEWVEFDVLLGEECKLLSLLCTQLAVEQLKTKSAECLLVILARKVSASIALRKLYQSKNFRDFFFLTIHC